MIAICIPSRGLVHSRTLEHIMDNIFPVENDFEFFFSHDLPIPECFNDVTERAIEAGADYIWYVEEDMGFPDGTFDYLLMMMKNCDAATLDYPVTDHHNAISDSVLGKPIFGTGCLLIKVDALKDVLPFRSDVEYRVNSNTTGTRDPHSVYGHHDVHMSVQLQDKGYEVGIAPMKGWQYRLKELGQNRTNVGYHKITKLQSHTR